MIGKGCPSASMKRGGFKFSNGKTRGCSWPKRWGCSFRIGTQTQRGAVPPPPPQSPWELGILDKSFQYQLHLHVEYRILQNKLVW